MNILLLNWRASGHPEYGGSEHYWDEICKRFISHGHHVTWISGGYKGCKKYEVVNNAEIYKIGGQLSLYLLTPFLYLFKLRKHIDFIIDTENGLPYFSPLWSRKPKVLHLHHVHGTKEANVWEQESKGKGIKMWLLGKVGYFLEMICMPFIYKNTKIVTISLSTEAEIQKYFNRKVEGIISPGIDNKYKPGKKSKKPTVIFIGRLKKYKSIDVLLKAASKLPKIKFIIIGEGDDESRLKEMVNTSKNIEFKGFVSNKEKIKYLQQATLVVNPSMVEGWSITNVESQACGTPVIGSNVNGIKDSVVNGKTGLLFEYGNDIELADKIQYLIRNPKIRDKMSQNAKKWAHSFSWEKAANKYLKLIR